MQTKKLGNHLYGYMDEMQFTASNKICSDEQKREGGDKYYQVNRRQEGKNKLLVNKIKTRR